MPASATFKTASKAVTLEPWQQSLLEARAIARMVLGREAGIQVAERHSGIYRGLIIGHTRDHLIQQIGNHAAAVIHSKDSFPAPEHPGQFPWPAVGDRVSIHYSQSRAVSREMRERVREQGRNG